MIIRNLVFITLSLQLVQSRMVLRSPRIVGGRGVDVEHVPYMVNIRRNGTFHCGGSLLTPKCVLTAAHCAYRHKPNEMVVRAGVTLLTERHNKRWVKKIIISPHYNIKTLDHDLAILQLVRPLQGHNIETIQLANTKPQMGDIVRVSGWGLVRENSSASKQLRSVYLKVLSQQKCIQLYRNYRNITDNMFCAFVPGVKDACLGDSGGPAVLDNQVVGIVSWGRNRECARSQSPGVYVNIESVKPWLEEVMLKNCY